MTPDPLATSEDVVGVGDHPVTTCAAGHDVLGRRTVEDVDEIVAAVADDGVPGALVSGTGEDVVVAPPAVQGVYGLESLYEVAAATAAYRIALVGPDEPVVAVVARESLRQSYPPIATSMASTSSIPRRPVIPAPLSR